MAKHCNPNLVKINRSYTVEEAASVFPVHKNTILNWIKNGLATCGDQRPWLILGSDLKEFIQLKRKKNKQTCQNHEIFCLRCKSPKLPAGNMVDYEPMSSTTGQLIGICSTCGSIINKYFSLAKLEQISTELDITLLKIQKHIRKSKMPTTNLISGGRAAAILGLKPCTLAQMRWRGDKRLPWVKLGKSVRYKLSDIEDYIEKNTVRDEVV